MSENNEREIQVNGLTTTRIILQDKPIGPDETRKIGFTVEPKEKPVGLVSGPLKIKIRYDDY